jgi:eukaryotic-like serine/threonine-protein kinase
VFVSPTVVGNTVILGSCAGSLYALDRITGAPIWIYDTSADGSAAQFHGEPLLLGDRVVIPTDSDPKGHLYSFDAASGDLLWKVPFNQGVSATPLLIDGRVVAVSAEGEVVAVDPKNGAAVWHEVLAGTLKALPFIPSPAYAANRIFVADNTTKLISLDAATGATIWRKTLPARVNTALVIVGKTLVLGTEDGYLNWVATDSGDVKKRVRLEEGRPYGTPILAPPLLFVLAAGTKGTLFALDAESGVIRWKQDTPKEWTTYRPLVTGSTVIVGSTEKNLCAFDRSSGETRWCHSIGQTPRGLGISSDGILYVGSLSGMVQAFRISTADSR